MPEALPQMSFGLRLHFTFVNKLEKKYIYGRERETLSWVKNGLCPVYARLELLT